MARRRDLLKSGLGAAAVAAWPWPLARAGFSITGSGAPDGEGSDTRNADAASPAAELFIYDERFAEARDAARHAHAHAHTLARQLRVASSSHVLSHLWYHELDARWRRAPMTFAGVTTERTLFVLETLALDRGMRVLERTAIPTKAAATTDGLVRWRIGPRPPHGAHPTKQGA